MAAFSVRLRLRAFLRGTGLEDQVGGAWAAADLFTANRKTVEIMDGSTTKVNALGCIMASFDAI